MFTFKKAPPPKIDQKALIVAIDAELDAQSTDEMIDATGKSREEILSACLADDEVDACREDVLSAITAKPWRIYDDVAKGTKGLDAETLNRLYKIIRRHIKAFAELAVLAKFNGYAVAEYVYKVEEDGFLSLDKVLTKEGVLDKYTPKPNGDVIYDGETGEMVIDQLAKFVVLKNRATVTRPMGEMSIIKAYPAVLLRKKGLTYASQFVARYAQPYVVGKRSGYGNLTNFTRELFGFLSGGAVGLAADDSLELHQLSGTGEAFELIERMANSRIQKLILGRVKTSELSSGSRAAQQTDDQARSDRIKSYLDLMVQAVQHALDALMLVNELYGKPILAPQGLWFEYTEQTKVDKERAERDKLYVDTGQLQLTREYLIDMVGYEDHHFTLVDGKDKGKDTALSQSPQTWQLSNTPADAILSLLNDCKDYGEFEKRLTHFTPPDIAPMLAGATTQAYMDGLNGVANADGEMRADD